MRLSRASLAYSSASASIAFVIERVTRPGPTCSTTSRYFTIGNGATDILATSARLTSKNGQPVHSKLSADTGQDHLTHMRHSRSGPEHLFQRLQQRVRVSQVGGPVAPLCSAVDTRFDLADHPNSPESGGHFFLMFRGRLAARALTVYGMTCASARHALANYRALRASGTVQAEVGATKWPSKNIVPPTGICPLPAVGFSHRTDVFGSRNRAARPRVCPVVLAGVALPWSRA